MPRVSMILLPRRSHQPQLVCPPLEEGQRRVESCVCCCSCFYYCSPAPQVHSPLLSHREPLFPKSRKLEGLPQEGVDPPHPPLSEGLDAIPCHGVVGVATPQSICEQPASAVSPGPFPAPWSTWWYMTKQYSIIDRR